jgi:hypothetical protein
MITKKNRPGQIIKVIAEQKDEQHLSQILMEETGTWGVRIYHCSRHLVNRDEQTVDLVLLGSQETVRLKIARNANGEIFRIKPEYEDLKRLAEKTKKPLREIMELAVAAAWEKYPY